MAITLESERVLLRHWQPSDLEPWIAMNQDPETLRYFPRTRTREESEESYERLRANLLIDSFGIWAAEEKSSGEFMGFIGLSQLELPEITFTPCNEIGWRLAKRYWGKGYATEAAQVAFDYVRNELSIGEIFSITSVLNQPSINVMKKIGLRERPELEFDHPRVEVGSPLRRHVVYST